MNYTMHKADDTQNGFTLLFAVLVGSLLLTIGVAIFNITIKEVILSSQARESQFSFYSADTGLECAFFWDKQHPGFTTGAFGSFTSSASGTFNNGIIARWRFDDAAGSATALDSSGNGNNGTLVNMDPINDWVLGQVRGALDFDGMNDQVYNATINAQERFSVSFWLYPRSHANYTQQFYANGGWGSFVFHTTDTGAVYVGTDWQQGSYPNGGRFTPSELPAGTVTLNTWQHFTYTYDVITGASFYKNGIQLGPTLGLPEPASWGGFGIGSPNPCCVTDGLVDELRIHNRALSSEEVLAMYTADISGPTPVPPVSQNSNVSCVGADISNPSTGWDSVNGWDVVTTKSGSVDTSYKTTFDLEFSGGTCATVTVLKKDDGSTRIESQGYNSCDTSNKRRVERALRATY